MAWSEDTKKFYGAAVARRGGELLGQIGNAPKALILLPCGHEKVMSVAGISSRNALTANKFRCALCRLESLDDSRPLELGGESKEASDAIHGIEGAPRKAHCADTDGRARSVKAVY